MTASTHLPAGAYGCHTDEQPPFADCGYGEKIHDPACRGCTRSGQLDFASILKSVQVSWAKRWGQYDG